MFELRTCPFVRLMATSPEIERFPFVRRPRTMAATWGGLLVCKLGAVFLISPATGSLLFAATLAAAGTLATYARFGSSGHETLRREVLGSPA